MEVLFILVCLASLSIVLLIFCNKVREQDENIKVSSNIHNKPYQQPKSNSAVSVKWDSNQTTYSSGSSEERPHIKTTSNMSLIQENPVTQETNTADSFRTFLLKYVIENGFYLKSFSHNNYKKEGRGVINLTIKSHNSKTYVVEPSVHYIPESTLLRIFSGMPEADPTYTTGKCMKETGEKHLSNYNPDSGDFIVFSFLDTGDWILLPMSGHLIKNPNNTNSNQPAYQSLHKGESSLDVNWDSTQTNYRMYNSNSNENYGKAYERWCDQNYLEPESPGSYEEWQEYCREQREQREEYNSYNPYDED